ncbi:MAG: DEAD/DEAH box helicase [Burkholderiales bacterium]|nr:DEAD/DEAH box helicase [Burkholderiales bacterium]
MSRAARTALDLQAARTDLEKEFGEQGFRNGIGFVTDKRIAIESAQIDEERVWHLVAKVQDGSGEPCTTTVEMEFFEFGIDLFAAECTCATRLNCKHAAGLAYLWTTLQPQRNGTLTGQPAEPIGDGVIPVIADAAEPPPSPTATTTLRTGLAPELSQWLRAGFEGTPRLRANDAEADNSKAAPDIVAYLLTERGELTIAKARRLKGGETKLNVQAASLAWVTHGHATPAYVAPEDEPILRMMAATIGMHSARPVLALGGVIGAQLLNMALKTQRLWLAPDGYTDSVTRARALKAADAPTLAEPLALGDAMRATLVWDETTTSQGPRMALRARGTDEAAAAASMPIIALEPPLAIDAARRSLRPLTTDVSASTLARLIALPALKPDDATAWAFVDDALRELPDFAAIPRCPTVVADSAGRVEPPLQVPQAVLRFALVEFDVSVGWGRNSSLQGRVFPAVQLLFRYPDGRVVPFQRNGLDHAVEQQRIGRELVGQRLRNVRVESQWEMRMPRMLYTADRVEPSLAYARDIKAVRESLWGLPDHDWSGRGPPVLADAQMAGFVIEIEAGFPISMTDIPEPTLDLAPGTEVGWYRLSLGVDIDGKRVDLAPALAKLIGAQQDPEQWVDALPSVQHVLLSVPVPDRVKAAQVVRLSGERIATILKPVFDWFHGGGVEQISELQAALLPDLPNFTVRYFGRDHPRWLAMRDKLREGTELTPVTAAPGFAATLRPYQNHGLSWLAHLYELGMGAVLADDMGLGKTVQTLAHLHRLHRGASSTAPSLIVAPTSVLTNWQREAERFAPTLKVHRHHGSVRAASATAFAKADVVLTSYPLLQRDEKLLTGIDWNVVVFDEAQTLKNAKAKTYVSAQSLRAQQRIALTGTPMENHLGELWAIFNVLIPGLLGSLESFNSLFRHPIEQRADSERMQRLKTRVRAFILRRGRDQVLGELPPKTEYTRWIELESAQSDLYEALRTAVHEDIRRVIEKKGLRQSTVHILDALLKLRQACCDPRLVKLPGQSAKAMNAGSAKLEWLATHVPELLEEGRRVLIFSQFTSMLDLIGQQLNEQQIPFALLTGDTVDRDTPIDRFQSGKVSVFLLSLKAGGVGLNLTAADTVIHYDPWWNPAVEAQATARAHRMGQDKPVIVTKLVAKGTLEEHMLTMLARKRDLAAALLDGGGNALTGLTLADVDELLSPLPH